MRKKAASSRALSAFAVLLLAVAAQTGQGEVTELKVLTQPPRHLYYAVTDGSVHSVDLYDSTPGPTVGPVHFFGGNVGASRRIAVVSEPQPLLYYSATDNSIRSIYLDTLTPGPYVPVGTFPAAVGAARGIAVHQGAHLVFAALVNGAVKVVAPFLPGPASAVDKALPTDIPSTKFIGGNVGASRQMAVDPLADLLYYSVTDGSIASVDLQSPTLGAGPSIPRTSLMGGNVGAGRSIAVDAETGWLWYAVSDGKVASINPLTLQNGDVLSSTLFAGGAVGAGRQIAVESSFSSIFADGFESGDVAAWSGASP